MFDNIAALKFSKNQSNNEVTALGMISAEKEEMEYKTTVAAEGRVEDWMTEVLNEMRRTNRLITKEAIFYYCTNNKTRYVFLFLCILHHTITYYYIGTDNSHIPLLY